MSTQRPDPTAETAAVELDPEVLGEEHVVDENLEAEPEEYVPAVEVDEPIREASPADVAEQIAEVPADDDEELLAEEEF
ncbi:hypothetical protein [Georgenia sp. AZ-5]|uniref:hypothetical protein n=1 Tax=Georgenia sp. AZ-5 TaxID=3367526 RepID=UPI0037546BE5